ncbi:hypothetical protein ACOSQ2_001579 [Xanthoceras sorbifolium]
MGFNSVYRFLMEIFPQIDSRLLKAVAIEHSKDADAAANVVLTEILPFWSERPVSSSSLPQDQSVSNFDLKDQSPRCLSDEDLGAEHEELSTLSRRRRIVVTSKDMGVGSSMEPGSIASGHVTDTDSTGALNMLNKELDMSPVSPFYDANDGNSRLSQISESEELILLGETHESRNDDSGNADLSQVIANTESNESVSLDKEEDLNVKAGHEQTPIVMSTSLLPENCVVNGNLTDVKVPPEIGFVDTPICELSPQVKSCLDSHVNVENFVKLVHSSFQEHTPDSLEFGLQAESGSGTSNVVCEVPDPSVSPCLISEQEISAIEDDHVDNETTIDTVVSRSGQICRINLLEEVVENAKTNKKTLFLAMESVMNLMREVELREKEAEEAKAEATRGGLDMLIKVEELKQMLSHAKQANDMHAGEVYGEKAILATEARELQTRLINLSEERDKSLAVLDEMRVTLEARLATAEEIRKAAEQEKINKEESARNFLAEQEAIMEMVVNESKFLQQEAEENSKLREFLMDRGHVVDSLQGEIAVICQDVRLLKENFDDRVPLSKSISSSQTTCILASSGSSMKSMASLVAEQVLASESPEKVSPTPSIHVESPKSRLEDERIGADRRELLDDEWEIFDKDTELYSSAL